MHPDSYPILAAAHEAQLRVKDSRFLARIMPVSSQAQAAELRRELGQRYLDARHLCWALSIGPPDTGLKRHSDAGEPAGSAGPPIARALASAGLSDLLCVVLRWFGGTKLGVGGLIRAYGEAAGLVLAGAQRAERLAKVELTGEIDYALEPGLRALLDRLSGEILGGEYGERIKCRLSLPPSALAEFEAVLGELTRGGRPFRRVEDESDPPSG